MRFALAIVALTSVVAVANANVATVGSSHLKLSTATKAVSKVAEISNKNVVITAAKKAVVAAPKPVLGDTLKLVGLFTLW